MQTTYPANQDIESHNRISDMLHQSREKLSDVGRAMTDQSKKMVRVTDEYVHRHAWIAVGIMAMIGLILGFFLPKR